MNRTNVVIIFLIILSAVIRIWFFLNIDNFEGSVSMEKVASALSIIDNPKLSFNFNGNTSVLYNYLLAFTLHLWPNILVAPRVLSMLFGVLTVIPFYLLVKLTFTERAAFYSGVLFALFPRHAIQSTFSMSDAIFLFFFFSCLYFIFKFKLKEEKIIWLVLSGLLFNLAALLRFESWAFIPFLCVLLLKEGKKYAALFFCLSLIAPCLWMLLCYYFQHDALASFTIAARTANMEIMMNRAWHSKNLLGWLDVLRRVLGYPIIISGLVGIIYSFLKKRFFYLALFFFYLYSLYTVNTIAARMWYIERYSILLGLLIIPYSVLSIEKLAAFIKAKPVILIFPFILLSTLMFEKITQGRIEWHTLPVEVKQIAGWLKDNISFSDKILMGQDKKDLYGYDIIVRSTVAQKNFHLVSFFTQNPPAGKNYVKGYFANEHPDYLVLSSSGFLEEILRFDMGHKEISDFGAIFKCVYSKEISGKERFNIYRIYYRKSDGK